VLDAVKRLLDYHVSSLIDSIIVGRLPDWLRDCTAFKRCMAEKTGEDIRAVVYGGEPWVNALDCMEETVDKCAIARVALG